MLAMGAVILLCVLALLAVPVEIVFSIQRHETFRSDVAIGWMFGLVRLPISTKSPKQPSRQGRKKEKPKTRKGRRRLFVILRNSRFHRRLFRFVKDLLGSIHVSSLRMSARLGLDDPADTGRLWGIVGPPAGALTASRWADIKIEPDFSGETFDLDSEGNIRIIPLKVTFIILTFLLAPVTLGAIWTLAVTEK